MSRSSGASLTSEWQKLELRLAKGKSRPPGTPTELPLASIRLHPHVFQHRDPRGHDGKPHVHTLVKIMGRSKGNPLAPLTVWWDGRGWTVIDGHHRIAAYRSASLGNDRLVPVEVFDGSLGEAMAQAAAGNSKPKLQMTTAENSRAAWRMVVMDASLSKAHIAESANVSQATVANMRRVHKQLSVAAENAESLVPSIDHRDMRWADAKRLADGRDALDRDWEAADEKAAEVMALAIRRAIGDMGSKKLHVLARALEIYDSRLEDALMEHWSRNNSEDDDSGSQ